MTQGELADPAGKLVLIVDDDEALVDLMTLVVSGQGFQVERAMDGESALWKVMNMSPDLVLLDLMLPKFGGFEIMDELKNSAAANIPIIIMTGRYNEASAAGRIKGCDVRAFIKKPVSHSFLTGLMHQILNTRAPSAPSAPPSR